MARSATAGHTATTPSTDPADDTEYLALTAKGRRLGLEEANVGNQRPDKGPGVTAVCNVKRSAALMDKGLPGPVSLLL